MLTITISDYSVAQTVKANGLTKSSFITQNGQNLVALITENRAMRSTFWHVDPFEEEAIEVELTSVRTKNQNFTSKIY